MDASEDSRMFWANSFSRLDFYLKEIGAKEKRMSETATANRQLSITRVFDAPRELVFDVWTQPEHIKNWFGCENMTILECTADLRVGGSYRYVTKGDGFEVPLKGEYFEVVRPERLVYSQIYDVEPYSASIAMVTVTFRDLDGKTELTDTIVFPDEESFQGASASGMEDGMALALDRFGSIVKSLI